MSPMPKSAGFFGLSPLIAFTIASPPSPNPYKNVDASTRLSYFQSDGRNVCYSRAESFSFQIASVANIRDFNLAHFNNTLL